MQVVQVAHGPHCNLGCDVFAVFASFFAAVSIWNRLEFTISKDERWLEAQNKDKVAGYMQQLAGYLDGRYLACSSLLSVSAVVFHCVYGVNCVFVMSSMTAPVCQHGLRCLPVC